MLDHIRRWFTREAAAALPWAEVEAWAHGAGHRFARAREAEGFVVDGKSGVSSVQGAPHAQAALPWRLEWGPPQRAYIAGRELRIRMELGLPPGLQMLVMSRGLMESLEHEIFERSTQDLQTHIDMSTPEEMRWLSMYAKSPVSANRAVRALFSGVANDPALLAAWVDDALAHRLEAAGRGLLRDGTPFLLMTLRGRLYLRLQIGAVTRSAVAQAVELFETAVPAALQVGVAVRSDDEGLPTAGSTAWQNQFPPEKG